MPSPSTINFTPGVNTLSTGDSISNGFDWMGGTGGLKDQINAALPPVTTPARAGSVSGRVASVSGRGAATIPTVARVPIVYANNGQAGFKAADFLADINTLIISPAPAICVLLLGVNDATNGTDPSAFRTTFDSILSTAIAGVPGIRFLCVSIWLNGEQWSSGPLRWSGPGANSLIDALNVQIVASAAAHNQCYVDIRAPTLPYEQANNTPEPGLTEGPLTATSDGIHPNATGKVQMGTYAFSVVTVSS